MTQTRKRITYNKRLNNKKKNLINSGKKRYFNTKKNSCKIPLKGQDGGSQTPEEEKEALNLSIMSKLDFLRYPQKFLKERKYTTIDSGSVKKITEKGVL